MHEAIVYKEHISTADVEVCPAFDGIVSYVERSGKQNDAQTFNVMNEFMFISLPFYTCGKLLEICGKTKHRMGSSRDRKNTVAATQVKSSLAET